MDGVKLFLASATVELDRERRELGDFIRSLNKILRPRGTFLDLTLSEDLSGALTAGGSQAEIDRAVRESAYVFVLIGAEAGPHTRGEFETALARFRETGVRPRIFTYFRAAPAGMDSASVRAFKDRLREIGHYYRAFVHPDTVKLYLLVEFVRAGLLSGPLKLEDGQAVVGGTPVLPLENVPLYNHRAYRERRREKALLDGEFARLQWRCRYGDEEAAVQLLDVSARRNELEAQIRQMEEAALSLCRTMGERSLPDRVRTWREEAAGRRLDAGDFEGALAVLRDGERQRELEHAERLAEAGRALAEQGLDGVRGVIGENRMRAAALIAGGVTAETLPELEACYAENAALSERYGVEMETLYEYAAFLREQNDFPKAIALGERLEAYFRREDPGDWKRSALDNLLGMCCADCRAFAEAETRFRAALERIRALAAEDAAAYTPDLAASCNNLALLLARTGSPAEAEPLYREALALRRELADRDPAVFKAYLAVSCDNLATLLADTGRPEEAETLYREALALHRELAEQNPAAYTPDLAKSRGNLAALLARNGRFRAAERLFRQALALWRDLADRNSAAFEPDLADACHNLAALLANTNRPAEAEPLCREALDRYRELADRNPAAYRLGLARSCAALASLLDAGGRPGEAEPVYREAAPLYRALGDGPELADILHRLANLTAEDGRPGEAEPLYREALDWYRTQENPSKCAELRNDLAVALYEDGRPGEAEPLYREALDFYQSEGAEPDAANTLCNLADLLADTDRPREAEQAYCGALDIYKKLEKARPAAYAPLAAETCLALCDLLSANGRLPSAEWFCRQALDTWRKLAEQDSDYAPAAAYACVRLAGLLKDSGRAGEEERLYRTALNIFRSLARSQPARYEPDAAETCVNLAVLYLHEWETPAAGIPFLRAALSLYEKYPEHDRDADNVRRLLERYG